MIPKIYNLLSNAKKCLKNRHIQEGNEELDERQKRRIYTSTNLWVTVEQ